MVAANIFSLVLIIGIFYFMIIRPQKKRQQQMKEMLDNLRVGDKIVTIGGINGVVVAIDEKTIIIATGDDEDTTLIMSKESISQVVKEEVKEIPQSTEEEDLEDDEEYEDDEDDEDEYEDEDDEYEDDEEEIEEEKEDKLNLSGRLSDNTIVHFSGGKRLIGEIVDVHLTEACGFYYKGELV